MNFAYYFFRSIRCRVPAPSVGFGEGGRLGAPAVLWGRGRQGDETRRGRKAAPVVPNGKLKIENGEVARRLGLSIFNFQFSIRPAEVNPCLG